ncbi:MAG: hypothetical protein ABI624_23815 [Casimicrobiaceae bacterium]
MPDPIAHVSPKGVPIPRRTLAWVLMGLTALDVGVQGIALLKPHPFAGFGVVAIAIMPIILFYYSALLLAIVAGIPLAIACAWTRNHVALPIGLVAAVLTVVNAQSFIAEYRAYSLRSAREDAGIRDYETKLAESARAVQHEFEAARPYFDVPRRVVALTGPSEIEFDNGVRVDIPTGNAPQAFRHFFYERLIGSDVRVVLQAPAPRHPRYRGNVLLDGTPIDQSTDFSRDFPILLPSSLTQGPARLVLRWFDPHSGDRTYAETAPPGYVTENRRFVVQAKPHASSRELYLCNLPLKRPESPEHFLSTDAACEGQETVALLGYIGASRDPYTPRTLVRCDITVQSPLLTGPRHLATTDVRECGASPTMVVGFVSE